MIWTDENWLTTAKGWIGEQLDRQGLSFTGEITQPHIRPWSTVLRIPTDDGDLFFKAASPSLIHEPRLTGMLAMRRPDCMPSLLASDEQAGWMLLKDMGVTLRSVINSVTELERWDGILRLYAEVQMEMAAGTEALLQAGALDRRLSTLPSQLASLLNDEAAVQLGLPVGLSSEQRRHLQRLVPRTREMCLELDSFGIPESLHHEDFHDANIFLLEGKPILSDWAESSVSHPFSTLLVTLRSVGYRLQLGQSSAEVDRLRDIYLEMWSAGISKGDLLRAFELAYRLGMISRALTWHRVTSPLPAPDRAEHGEAVPGWLLEFLESFQQDRRGNGPADRVKATA